MKKKYLFQFVINRRSLNYYMQEHTLYHWGIIGYVLHIIYYSINIFSCRRDDRNKNKNEYRFLHASSIGNKVTISVNQEEVFLI
jgi:hypothetical protein